MDDNSSEELSDKIKRMDIKEFKNLGFLQEANRLFFHPLGLALEIVIQNDGTYRLGGMWDYREDSEGIMFDSKALSKEKAAHVAAERSIHSEARKKLFDGDVIQEIV